MPAVQHFAEHAVGVIAALVSALAILVVDPRVHDHLAGRVVAEEQPVLLEKLRAEPMLVVAAKRPTLAVLRSRRVLRDDIERQPGDRSQSLAGVLFHVPDRILLLQGLDLPYQRFNLCQEQRMGEDRPAVNDQGLGLARDHSLSAESAASRSISTSPTRDRSRWARPASTDCRRSGWRVMSWARKPRKWPSTGSSLSEASARRRSEERRVGKGGVRPFRSRG